MRTIIAFSGVSLCLLFCFGHAFAQKNFPKLIGEVRYHVYIDIKGNIYIVPIDSVHYGYTGGKESEVKCAYNNTIDTDKYPEMAYLPDPGFFDIYPSNCDTAMKFDNVPDTSSLVPKWNMTYFEADVYNEHNNPDKKFDMLNKSVEEHKYDDQNRLLANHIYVYKKGTDSAVEAGHIQYSYDNNGRMVSREFIQANSTDPTVPILYDYDVQGRMSEVRSPHRVVSFSYDSSKLAKIITMVITETNNVSEPQISIRCSYEYEHENVVLYYEEKYDSSAGAWMPITTDTITYDNKHHVTSFKDGGMGLYHNYKIQYNSLGLAVKRTADETGSDDVHKLPDGTMVRLAKTECTYYYEPYVSTEPGTTKHRK